MASSSSTTAVLCEDQTMPESPLPQQLTLKLRARRPRVRWADGVVDNEELQRKKSKCCCQYHKPQEFDESSDDEAGTHALSDGESCP
mmetsp:Transcript_46790/g.101636  ORF Transcript_46790/g.101636 Transcript_46790/m.101636 type:complete len:87 (-) Transcript_46790:452-712(-)|eukprot:6211970-Pleurochrysis_carterae.AAC.10